MTHVVILLTFAKYVPWSLNPFLLFMKHMNMELPVDGALFLAALVASCFLGAFPPVDFLAVCLVRAMIRGERNDY